MKRGGTKDVGRRRSGLAKPGRDSYARRCLRRDRYFDLKNTSDTYPSSAALHGRPYSDK